MVKPLSTELKAAIAQALRDAEKRTSAEIMLIVSPSSDHYQDQVMVYGLAAGSLTCLALWLGKTVVFYPQLLLLQIAIMTLVTFVPPLRALAVALVPKRIKHHMAARRALEEFVFASRHVPAEKPVVFLYVSLAERYVHILHSRAVPEKVPHQKWEDTVTEFTGLMKSAGLKDACLTSISTIAKTLQVAFPPV